MGSELLHNNNNGNDTIKFLCSYGGKILPRRTDGILRYYGGHTRVLAFHPSTSFSELMTKINELCGSPATLRCPLPNGDLDTLVSVKNDEDLANIIEEYDRASSSLPHRLKIRAILLPMDKSSPSPSSSSSASHTPPGSPHTSASSPSCSETHRFGCWNCSATATAYSRWPRNGAVKFGSPHSSPCSLPCYAVQRFGCRNCSSGAYPTSVRIGAAKSGSPQSSGGSPPYSVAHRFGCQDCSLISYPIGVCNAAAKGC
ncbi:hypothetical protein DEO72_LG2g1344 [Vigna unguiculata]|uniref:PB1 domain-containing protein n=1 Tax=Vigna unguiculata TaxID=3917 RepID=A0A4D6KW70_VIGUN|nr:hypothetical protein DEO72_LG2g1344 [Vigna unguiculata]